MPNETVLTSQFHATSKDGRDFLIFEYTTYVISKTTFDSPPTRTEGWKKLVTSDGLDVGPLDNGEYKIVESGLVLQRIQN